MSSIENIYLHQFQLLLLLLLLRKRMIHLLFAKVLSIYCSQKQTKKNDIKFNWIAYCQLVPFPLWMVPWFCSLFFLVLNLIAVVVQPSNCRIGLLLNVRTCALAQRLKMNKRKRIDTDFFFKVLYKMFKLHVKEFYFCALKLERQAITTIRMGFEDLAVFVSFCLLCVRALFEWSTTFAQAFE